MTTLRDLYAGVGPVAAILDGAPYDAAAVGYTRPPDFAVRAVRCLKMPTVAAVFDEFAAAMQFPYYFGGNKDAFDECMRELDETVGAATGYLIVARDADALLSGQPEELAWFAEAMTFYAEHWAAQGVVFKVLLQTTQADAVGRAWAKAGVRPDLIGA